MEQAEISYPCTWEYRIIAESRDDVEKIIFENIHKPYKLELKNTSANGKYLSMHLSLEVESKIERDGIFQKLSSHPKIKMVI